MLEASVKSVLGVIPTLLVVLGLLAVASIMLSLWFSPKCPSCKKRMGYRPECDIGHKFCTIWECGCGYSEVIPKEPPPPPGPPPKPLFDPNESVFSFLKRPEIVGLVVIEAVMLGVMAVFFAYPCDPCEAMVM
jgi:thiol-disulfide isomerase/thioredoxin